MQTALKAVGAVTKMQAVVKIGADAEFVVTGNGLRHFSGGNGNPETIMDGVASLVAVLDQMQETLAAVSHFDAAYRNNDIETMEHLYPQIKSLAGDSCSCKYDDCFYSFVRSRVKEKVDALGAAMTTPGDPLPGENTYEEADSMQTDN